MNLVHFILGSGWIHTLYNTSGYTYYGGTGRYLLQNHTSGSNLGIVPYLKGSQHLGSGTDHYIVSDGRMTLSVFLTRTPQGYTLVQSDIISNNGGLADNHSVAMIDKKTFSNLCTRVNFDSRLPGCFLRYPSGQKIMLFQVHFVSHTIIKHNLKAWVQEHFHIRMNGRIPFPDYLYFLFYSTDDTHLFQPDLFY